MTGRDAGLVRFAHGFRARCDGYTGRCDDAGDGFRRAVRICAQYSAYRRHRDRPCLTDCHGRRRSRNRSPILPGIADGTAYRRIGLSVVAGMDDRPPRCAGVNDRCSGVTDGIFKGLLLLWLNPKGWTMAMAAASAYAGLSDDPLRLALLLGAVFGLTAPLSLTLWCMGGQWLSRVLKTETQWRAVNVRARPLRWRPLSCRCGARLCRSDKFPAKAARSALKAAPPALPSACRCARDIR